MSFLPFIGNAVLATVVTVYSAVSSIFPIHPVPPSAHQPTIIQREARNMVSDFMRSVTQSESPTPSAVPTLSQKATLTPSQTPSDEITAQTDIRSQGKTIHILMKYPKNGGAITGVISGDCTGKLTGAYANEKFMGNGKATCRMGILDIPVTITFTGKLTSPTDAAIMYTLSAVGQTDSGQTTLSFTH